MGLTTACLYKFGTVPVESEVLIILTTIGAKRSIILKNKEVGNISNGHDDGFIFLSKTMTSSNETAENLVQEQFGVATTMVLSSSGSRHGHLFMSHGGRHEQLKKKSSVPRRFSIFYHFNSIIGNGAPAC